MGEEMKNFRKDRSFEKDQMEIQELKEYSI